MFDLWHRVPVFHRALYGAANVVLNSLNVYWFYKIAETAVGNIRSAKVKSSGKQE